MLSTLRQRLIDEIESPAPRRSFGKGWISGMIALLGSIAALAITLCILFPDLLTTPQLQSLYEKLSYRILLQCILLLSFGFALLSLILRDTKILGITAILCVLATTILGQYGFKVPRLGGVFFGLDWFLLNVLFSGLLFIPVERAFAQWPQQHLFRAEWREDLFYYFISSTMVQILSFLSLWPSQALLSHTHQFEAFRLSVFSQPYILQFLEIMFLTDFMQYWVHRMFHRIPVLWKFHAVHHSAKSLDWMASARMHFVEIFLLRGITVIPMMVLGFSSAVIQMYIFAVYLYSTFIHTNVRWQLSTITPYIVTPRFHHWHHGIEREAINVNFAIHFPLLDRLFGTYYMPEDRWPSGYGIGGHPVPQGYIAQFMYPFKRKRR